MRRHLVARAAPALLAVFLLLPAGALAQSAPRSSAGPEAAAPSGKTAAAGQKGEQMVLQRVNRRIADLRAKLRITTAEEPQWHRFAEMMRANARQMAQKFTEREQGFRSMNAVEDMKSYAGIAEQHAKNMERLVPAFENLYSSLSPEQKSTADRLWRSYAEQARRRHRG